MDWATIKVRRATVDDLPQLIKLWQIEQLPWQVLERRITEFQVVADADGRILGALGFQMANQQAQIHSEVILLSEYADKLREKLWERLQNLAQSFALVRLWTCATVPFWRGNGFQPPAAEQRQKFPPVFGDPAAAWLVVQLREEAPPTDLEKEFNLFREAERARTAEAFRQARLLKTIANLLGALLFLGVLIGMSYLMLKRR
jgi:N-acetylglutamate synthase-like GNAT family acetyltransferase